MPDYRCYRVSPLGAILGPANVITCADDETAIIKAQEIFPEGALEVWQGARRVYVGPHARPRRGGSG
jgi:hypothetical protein